MNCFFWLGTLEGGAEQRDMQMVEYLVEHHGVEPVIGLFDKSEDCEFEQLIIPKSFNTRKLRGWNNWYAERYFMKHYVDGFDAYFCRYAWQHKNKFWFYRISGDIRKTRQANIFGKLLYYPLLKMNLKNLKRADAILSCSRVSDELVEECGQKNIIRTNQFIDTSIFFPKGRRIRKDKFRVLFVGRDDPIKNLKNLKKACERLDIELRTAGVDRWYSKSELVEEYRKVDLVILPSFYESFGIVALEALACGTRVLLSENVTAGKELENFVHVCDTSVESIKLAIKKVMIRKDKISPMITKHIRLNYTKKNILKKECAEIMRHYYGKRGILENKK